MMTAADTESLLNELLAREYRSLPMFLVWSCPYLSEGSEESARTLRSVIQDQKELSGRIAEAILLRGASPDSGEFPIEWTSLHDLSLAYLWPQLVAAQRRHVAAIARIVAALGEGAARALAEEVLGAERAHLEAFERAQALQAA